MKKFLIIAHSANHYFRLAEFLDKKKLLEKIISIYPKFKLKDYSISNNKIKFLFFPFMVFCLRRFLKIKLSNIFYSKVFNTFCKIHIKKSEEKKILIGLNGYCLDSIKSAKKKGFLTIVDRACPHINIQKQIIYNELDKLPVLHSNKIKKDYFDQKIVDQMLMEYDNCDLISVPSSFTIDSFKKFNFDKKILLNQITPEKVLQINKSQNISDPSFKIFSIGFNFIRKGFYYLIESMRLLENENIRLDLRTNIPSYLDIKKIPKNINLISSHISKTDLEYYYNNSDLVILPSVDEGFGMVALEAMCLKKAVLVTKNVGMKDILTKYLNNSNNYIIQPGDIDQLSRKIFELSKNKTNLRQEGELFFEAANKYLEKDTFKGYTNL
jgi:glycosyltransferase involved in cell wall biosynthesis